MISTRTGARGTAGRGGAGGHRGTTTALVVRRAAIRILPLLWVLGIIGWQCWGVTELDLAPLLAAAPVIACASTGRRHCVVLGGICALFALFPASGAATGAGLGHRIGSFAAILAVIVASYLTAGRRVRLKRELARAREVAAAAQQALLPPLPRQLDGLEVSAGHLSATRGATLGGDLYDAAATPYGVRIVIGDVRGHGLETIGTVGAVLGSFREAVYDEPELEGVLRRLERGLARYLGDRRAERGTPAEEVTPEGASADGRAGSPAGPPAGSPAEFSEEFITVLLLEVGQDGKVVALNCGHPWPYRLDTSGGRALPCEPVTEAEPLPPLGLFPLPAAPARQRFTLRPGESMLLYTDGAPDARDADGVHFPLPEVLTGTLGGMAAGSAARPEALVDAVLASLREHTGGSLCDDAALLVVRRPGARGAPAPDLAGQAAGRA